MNYNCSISKLTSFVYIFSQLNLVVHAKRGTPLQIPIAKSFLKHKQGFKQILQAVITKSSKA